MEVTRGKLTSKGFLVSLKYFCFRFPVRRVYCVAQNYWDHNLEMGANPAFPESPFFFSKPYDSIVDCSYVQTIRLPSYSKQVEWEAEVVVAIGKGGASLRPEIVEDHIFGYAIGVDLTCRDIQREAKSKGRPWDFSKGFDYSGPVAAIVPKETFGNIANQRIYLEVNSELKQNSSLDKMIWSIPHIVSYLSHRIRLYPGDLIFTGTPKGVGPLKDGDYVRSCAEGLPPCEFSVVYSKEPYTSLG